ncbi:MAG: cell division protein ZapA [Spirochaetia bacterium]|nr:cell division protein ZapA [Spirochaetia bacterium]
MEKSVITVNILGNEYTIKGVARPDYIISLANYLNNRMTEVQEATGLKDAKKIAILAAINICDELFDLKKQLKESYVPNDQLTTIRNRIEQLIALIDTSFPAELHASNPHEPGPQEPPVAPEAPPQSSDDNGTASGNNSI